MDEVPSLSTSSPLECPHDYLKPRTHQQSTPHLCVLCTHYSIAAASHLFHTATGGAVAWPVSPVSPHAIDQPSTPSRFPAMSVEAEDDVRLARLDATLSEDSRYAYVKHVYYGWKKDEGEEYVWRRTYKPIGSGGFGAVYREECVEGRDKGNQRAVKILPKPATLDTRRIDISRELEAIARFSRPEFAQFFVSSQGWYEDTTSIFIVMELLPLGNLQQYIGSALPETECKLITAQILQGLAYLHRDGYVHRDLKPQVSIVHLGTSHSSLS